MLVKQGLDRPPIALAVLSSGIVGMFFGWYGADRASIRSKRCGIIPDHHEFLPAAETIVPPARISTFKCNRETKCCARIRPRSS